MDTGYLRLRSVLVHLVSTSDLDHQNHKYMLKLQTLLRSSKNASDIGFASFLSGWQRSVRYHRFPCPDGAEAEFVSGERFLTQFRLT